MKKFSLCVRIAVSVIAIILAIAFLVIEGSLFFLGDFLLYENVILAFFKGLIRLLIPLFVLYTGVISIIKRDTDFTIEAIGIAVCVLVMAPFMSNGFGLYLSIAAIVFALGNLFYHFAK